MKGTLGSWGALVAGGGVLIAGLAIAFRLLVGAPEEAAAARTRYASCLKAADDTSRMRWAHSCRDKATERPAKLAECKARADFTSNRDVRLLELEDCDSQLGVASSGKCSLPSDEARRFDEFHAADRAGCLAAARANL